MSDAKHTPGPPDGAAYVLSALTAFPDRAIMFNPRDRFGWGKLCSSGATRTLALPDGGRLERAVDFLENEGAVAVTVLPCGARLVTPSRAAIAKAEGRS